MPAQRPVAVIDLDGVVADVRHRLHHISGGRRDWDRFFAAVGDDEALAEGVAVVERLSADHDIVYLTGRPERTRPATLEWLDRHRLPRAEMIMRSDRDRRPARMTKVAALTRLTDAGRTIGVVVDDDPEVCAAVRARGWPVLVADWMPRTETLQRAQEREGGT
jgi:phosphoglycolate phosphatase-like HAD superfamily hydrolase